MAAINYKVQVLNAFALWWNINTFIYMMPQENAIIQKQAASCERSLTAKCLYIYIFSAQKQESIIYQGQVFPHECPHSRTFEKASQNLHI